MVAVASTLRVKDLRRPDAKSRKAVDQAPFDEKFLSRLDRIRDRKLRLDGNRRINTHIDRARMRLTAERLLENMQVISHSSGEILLSILDRSGDDLLLLHPTEFYFNTYSCALVRAGRSPFDLR
jgi:hypothetical protein